VSQTAYAKNVGRQGQNRAIKVSINPPSLTSKREAQKRTLPKNRSGVQMLPSPPVLLQVSAFSFHFPQFRMGAAVHEAGPPDGCLLACTSLGVSVPLRISGRLSGHGVYKCSHFTRKRNQIPHSQSARQKFPPPILICATHAGFPPKSHGRRSVCVTHQAKVKT
jgi:hypothetical protein